MTALVTAAVLRNGRTAQDPLVAKSLKYLEGFVPRRRHLAEESTHENYETCASMQCFSEANPDDRYDKLLAIRPVREESAMG